MRGLQGKLQVFYGFTLLEMLLFKISFYRENIILLTLYVDIFHFIEYTPIVSFYSIFTKIEQVGTVSLKVNGAGLPDKFPVHRKKFIGGQPLAPIASPQ